MVRQANVNNRDTQLANIKHVITNYNSIDRTSVPVCSYCRQNRHTVAGEQVGELLRVGVVVTFQPNVEIADNINRLLKRRYGVKNTRSGKRLKLNRSSRFGIASL